MPSLGMAAAILSSVAIFPQVFKIAQTGETHALSLWFYVLLTAAAACWYVYGRDTHDKPIWISAIVQIGMLSLVLLFKLSNVLRGIDPFNAL